MSITDLVTGKFRMALMGAVLLLAFGAGWIANGWRLGEQLAALGKTHSDTLGEIARAGQQQLRVQIQRREVLEQKLADLDASTHKDLENAQAENERLLGLYSGADAERKRLRIEVRVARADITVSEATGAGSMGNGERLELSERAGSAVWNIRRGVISNQAKLEYLQGYVCEIRPDLAACR